MASGFIFRTLGLLGLAFALLVALVRMQGPDIEPALEAAKSGVVLDAASGQPLAGVFVSMRWLEQSSDAALLGGSVRGQCLNRVVVRTDGAGRYAIPAARLPDAASRPGVATRGYFWDLYTYAPGYAAQDAGATAHPRATMTAAGAAAVEPVRLSAVHDTPQQRLATLADTLAHFTCHPFAHDAGMIESSVAAEAAAAACLPGAANDEASCAMFRQASAQVL